MIDKVCNVAGSGHVAHPEAWTRLKGCQSFTDAQSCLNSMKWHLVNSSQHYMDPTDVALLFETLVPELEYVRKERSDNVDGAPGTPPLAGATPPSNAPPLHVLAKRQWTSSGGDGSSSGGGASSGGGGTVSVHVDRAELTDMLTLRRSTLLTMLDCVERAAASAKHAVAMSIAARNGLETEERRLSDCARQLARICDR